MESHQVCLGCSQLTGETRENVVIDRSMDGSCEWMVSAFFCQPPSTAGWCQDIEPLYLFQELEPDLKQALLGAAKNFGTEKWYWIDMVNGYQFISIYFCEVAHHTFIYINYSPEN